MGSPHPDPVYADMEKRILERINKLGIGPMGLGGRTTSLAVHIVSHPCHIASFPVAVNINCHSHRIVEIDFRRINMVEIRFHGRGGQGTVVASKILADAVSKEDK